MTTCRAEILTAFCSPESSISGASVAHSTRDGSCKYAADCSLWPSSDLRHATDSSTITRSCMCSSNKIQPGPHKSSRCALSFTHSRQRIRGNGMNYMLSRQQCSYIPAPPPMLNPQLRGRRHKQPLQDRKGSQIVLHQFLRNP
jgi:hypothetical protein